ANTGSFQSSGSVITTQTGAYTIEYLKVDVAGNTGSTTRTVNVILSDTEAPIITLVGNTNLSIPLGGVYSDLGATWSDNVDGTGTIVANGSVNTSIAGLYILVYNHTDVAGNVGVFERRFVTVVAPQPSQVSVVGAGGGGGGSSYGMPVYIQNSSNQMTLNSASTRRPITNTTSSIIGIYRSKLYKSLVELRIKKFPSSEFALKRKQLVSSSDESMSMSQ
ncbi:DUF5011 domain-containing protein, partial [Candidatus Gracilibacteria bacterium]|nr:DUF5011 domain-containing protein [Candidatus Gracilibacteria bacterium]